MRIYGGAHVYIHAFLISVTVCEWSPSHSGRITPTERVSGTHLTRGWVGPRTGLDEAEKNKILPLQGLETRPLGRPVRSQSLYRLRYPPLHNHCCDNLDIQHDLCCYVCIPGAYLNSHSSAKFIFGNTLNLRCTLGVSNEPFFSLDEIDSRLL
jgi:hypothetical protein